MQVDDGANLVPAKIRVIAISENGTDWDYIAKANIVKISGVFSAVPGQYSLATKTIIRITMVDGSAFDIEAQRVQNQAGWSGGTSAALNAALSDIAAWL